MVFSHIPISHPQPDVTRLIDHLLGKRKLASPPLIEFIIDPPILKAITTGLLGRSWVERGSDRETQKAYLDNLIQVWYRLGYAGLVADLSLDFPAPQVRTDNTARGSQGQRAWVDEHQGAIQTWEDFERYPFPKVEQIDFFPFEYLNQHLPEGMGLFLSHGGGVFERLSWIFSIEGLCLALYDQPDLVRAVANRIGELQVQFYRQILDFDRLVALFPGDDMGFRSGTLVSPKALRDYCLPWQTEIARMAHTRGIPYFLHSCGNLTKILPDLIETVGIDGKHSFEDAILPVQEFHQQYSGRIASLGGMDVHLLASASPAQIREKVRFLAAECGPLGRYALGSGNSIPDYVPVENYLTMVDETLALQACTSA